MKAIAIINQYQDANKTQWQFDMVMAAIAYDFDLSIIFMHEGCQQITNNKAWKCLSLYGVSDVYFYHKSRSIFDKKLFPIKPLTKTSLVQLIQMSDIIL